ncbi:MFS transporter [Knoellia sp. Soil729]|uniref:MFS transporter n=1 Tax=Knoellia sp. Soil729 TaxID=1736394 RepID=UPI00138F2ED7|nr:MFS transporter [Knoellia sp. Soil729]
MASTMLAASAMTTLGAVPVFLLSAQSVFVRSDLKFDEAHFGLAASCFFASAAVAAMLGGRWVDRLGRRRSTILAGLLACAGGVGMAVVAHSYAVMVAMLILLGFANAALQITSNLSLATAIPLNRQGLAFGVKQSAVPFAILLGGISVPTVGALVGWRWTFGIAGIAGVLVLASAFNLPDDKGARAKVVVGPERPPTGAMALTVCGMAVASASVNSLGAFIASWGFEVGMSPAQAGLLMAAGSGLSIIARILTGHLADRRNGGNLAVVIKQLLIGALAFLAISVGTIPTLWVATIIAFVLGWSWPGLLLFAVVRVGRGATGAASGALQAGAFVGGAAGPVLFGILVSHTSYPVSWRVGGGFMLLAAGLLALARRQFLLDLAVRPLIR